MCGVIGIVSSENAQEKALLALSRLEYRGYDSAGIASINDGEIECVKSIGKIENLKQKYESNRIDGDVCIGHIRWATHGQPSEKNAHPIIAGNVAVVHNGIIENYRQLKDELLKQGAVFSSDTDTEVIAQLINLAIERGLSPLAAVQDAISDLKGSFAISVIFKGHDDMLIGARNKSPLIVGRGKSSIAICSDQIGLVDVCDEIAFLENGEIVCIKQSTVEFFNFTGERLDRSFSPIAVDSFSVEKAGYPHFMLKEIMEQPKVIRDTVGEYRLPEGISKISILACGSSYYAGYVAKYWFEKYLKVQTQVEIASEYIYRDSVINENELFLAISQSGETSDTIAAMNKVRSFGTLASIVNVKNSALARMSEHVFLTQAGPEIGVASTKTFVAQLVMLASIAFCGSLNNDLLHISDIYQNALNDINSMTERISQRLASFKHAIFLGRGLMYPIAMEAALKLKELTYIHAEAFAGGELKHGPLALIDDDIPVFFFINSGELFEKSISNLNEVMARGKNVFVVTDSDNMHGDNIIRIHPVHHELSPIMFAAFAQLLAYNTANVLGHDVDKPRNLAKSVTVE